MSYIVLARKYRPRSFTEMVGQEHVVQALGNALTRQRLHHAYLFTGTRGVGKTTVSRILAKSLNCTGVDGNGSVTASPCGVCNACRDIDSGRFVDYVELDAASNRGVDEISQLLDQSVYKPVVGRFKVYMIDEVHMLSTTAFNAMLKTLEEPPDYLKFVLATTDPQKVPVTVLSRCLQFNLRPMAPETVQAHLGLVLRAEAVAADAGSLRLLSRAARGSMRDALSLTDQAIAFGDGALEESTVRQMLGAVDRSHVVRLIEALITSDGAALVRTVDQLRGLGLSAAGALEDLAQAAQQMAVQQAVPGAADPQDPDTPVIQALAARLPADETQLLYSIALHGRAELALAPDEYSGLIMVLLRMLAFRPTGAVVVAAAPSTPVAPAPAPVSAPTSRELLRSISANANATVRTSASVLQQPLPARPQSLPRPQTQLSPKSALRPVQTPPAPTPQVVAASTPPWEEEPPGWGDIPMEGAAVPSTLPRLAPAAQAPMPAPALAPEASSVELNDPLVTRWVDLFARMTLTGLVRELALQAQAVSVTETPGQPMHWVVRVERESLRQTSHRERLQNALSDLLAQPVTLEVTHGVVTDSALRREIARREQAQRTAEAIITQDPMVIELLARHPTARIVPGSIRPL